MHADAGELVEKIMVNLTLHQVFPCSNLSCRNLLQININFSYCNLPVELLRSHNHLSNRDPPILLC